MSLSNNIIDLIKNNETRLEWDEYFISIAFLISSRSPSNRLKVGSVIVKDNRIISAGYNRIISAGYNGYPTGTPHVSIVRNNHEQNAIHSEQNAVSDAAKRGVSINNTTIYVTHFPCINCAKTIISSGIKTVKYKVEYKHDNLVDELFEISGVNVECL